LVFAIEEETDLAKRIEIVFVCQLHHSATHLIIGRETMQAKNASAPVA
jgi:hypothetical protein